MSTASLQSHCIIKHLWSYHYQQGGAAQFHLHQLQNWSSVCNIQQNEADWAAHPEQWLAMLCKGQVTL